MSGSEVNWPIIIYVIFAVIILLVLHHGLGISFPQIFAVMAKEFRSLSRGQNNRGSLNAALILCLAVLCAFYFLVEPVRKLIELYSEMAESHNAPAFEFLTALFLIAVVGILSVLVTKRD
jgi:predicted membrane metal-binding protein